MTAERVKPIKPSEVVRKKVFPNEVLESFNELIAQNSQGGESTVHQKDVVRLMIQKGLKRDDIFKNHWLDVEDVYRKSGWRVSYDSPGWDETYEPFFSFKARRRIMHED